MNGISTNWRTERLYLGKSSVLTYENDRAFASLVSEPSKSAESSENNFDFRICM